VTDKWANCINALGMKFYLSAELQQELTNPQLLCAKDTVNEKVNQTHLC